MLHGETRDHYFYLVREPKKYIKEATRDDCQGSQILGFDRPNFNEKLNHRLMNESMISYGYDWALIVKIKE